MVSPGPLFEREWRERFRRFPSHLWLGGLVSVFALLVCLGAYRAALNPDLPALSWRAGGRALLDLYRWAGGLGFWSGALLLGATSVSDEKTASTWEHLLLCPIGGRGLAVGKIASGAAYLVALQLALLPVLLVAASCFGASPLEIGGVMLSHLLLTIQGATLGLWGALRGQSLLDGLEHSLGGIGRILMQTVLLLVFASCVVIPLGAAFAAATKLSAVSLAVFFKWVSVAFIGAMLLVGQAFLSFVAGVTGLGVGAQSIREANEFLLAPCIWAGQLMGVALFLKWSVWEIDNPTRDFWGVTDARVRDHVPNDHLHVLYRVWSWTLSPAQLAAFPIKERREPLIKAHNLLPTWEQTFIPSPAPPPTKEAPKKNTNRMRAPVSRRWQELNPVLWLDLTRCLSLRSPDSNMVPILFTVAALGGSLLLAISLFLLVGWVQNGVLGGPRADVSSLVSTWNDLHWTLRWGALACGPLWGATGYVVERRTGMLVELRLTLISARAMWLGKFLSRFGIFALLSLPMLAFVAFFACNWPDKNGAYEVASALVSSWALAAWSCLACLWLSDSSRKELASALWCGAFAISWGVLLWNFPTFGWTPVHLFGATLAGGHLLWRLKRLGFG